MKEYIPLNQKKKSKWRKVFVAIVGATVFGLGVYTPTVYGVIVGLFIMASALISKTARVNKDGISMDYDVKFYRYTDVWDFDRIEYIHREFGTIQGQVMLHFTKGAMSKKLLFLSEEAEEIIVLARKKNKDIFVDTAK